MAVTGNLVSDWLISKKSSPLKPLGQMNQNLVGSILGRSSITEFLKKKILVSVIWSDTLQNFVSLNKLLSVR
jgi:hypothetical protein